MVSPCSEALAADVVPACSDAVAAGEVATLEVLPHVDAAAGTGDPGEPAAVAAEPVAVAAGAVGEALPGAGLLAPVTPAGYSEQLAGNVIVANKESDVYQNGIMSKQLTSDGLVAAHCAHLDLRGESRRYIARCVGPCRGGHATTLGNSVCVRSKVTGRFSCVWAPVVVYSGPGGGMNSVAGHGHHSVSSHARHLTLGAVGNRLGHRLGNCNIG